MELVVAVVSGLAGLALMFFAGRRDLPRTRVPWQVAACLVYLGVGVAGFVGSGSNPSWVVSMLLGGGVGILVSVLMAGRRLPIE